MKRFCGLALGSGTDSEFYSHGPRYSQPTPPIKNLDDCDFTPIADHYNKLREAKKSATKEEKEAAKKEKLALEEKYGFATVDGRKEKVGNFRVEPPGLFRGRGAHPKAGCLKVCVCLLAFSLKVKF